MARPHGLSHDGQRSARETEICAHWSDSTGKTLGARHRVTLAIEGLLEGEHEALTRKAIEKAMEGDMTALRLCLDRLAPARKDSPITFDLPPVQSALDAAGASAAVLTAVASGEVTPDEGGRVMALLVAHKGIVETCDLESRITALEGKVKT